MHPAIQLALRAALSVAEHYAQVADRYELARKDNELPELLAFCSKKVEQSLARQLIRAYPEASFNGIYQQISGQGPLKWQVNSLLGYTNLSRGFPVYGLSLSIYNAEKLEHAIIYNPATDEEFIASRGRGASLNGKRIRVTSGYNPSKATLALSYPTAEKTATYLPTYLNLAENLGVDSLVNRNCPSLDICALAAGQLDAGIFLGVNEAELTPALLILKEAGGLHSNLKGEPKLAATDNLLAANPKAFRQLINQLNQL